MRIFAALLFAIYFSQSAHADEPDLYYQTTDYAVFICQAPKEAAVANAISHGYSFGGDNIAEGRWLEERKSKKACQLLPPGQRFMTSSATPFYMRSQNNVQWLVQVLPPSNKAHPLGWVPINQIQFIPIPNI